LIRNKVVYVSAGIEDLERFFIIKGSPFSTSRTKMSIYSEMFVTRYSGKSVCILFHWRKNREEKKT
jgi:hypothetical protein